ncbi:hypothetical protein MXB_2819 [Myxobolus squamalis]|nr:hypothetical protein MXB_2819 [Myxobolus squamalis]
MYPFKEEKMLKPWYIHRQSAYLIGRDRRVIDIPIDHPSCSKQHAVIQYRKVPASTHCPNEFTVKPYIMDLGSANGTYLNNDKITIRRYYELLNKDVIRFAFSTREYVILDEDFHESSDSC